MTNIRSKLHQFARAVLRVMYNLGDLTEGERAMRVRFLLEDRNWIYQTVDVLPCERQL